MQFSAPLKVVYKLDCAFL